MKFTSLFGTINKRFNKDKGEMNTKNFENRKKYFFK